jgi:hypothetical protein
MDQGGQRHAAVMPDIRCQRCAALTLNAIWEPAMPVTTHTSHSGFRAMQKIATIQVSSRVHPENPG